MFLRELRPLLPSFPGSLYQFMQNASLFLQTTLEHGITSFLYLEVLPNKYVNRNAQLGVKKNIKSNDFPYISSCDIRKILFHCCLGLFTFPGFCFKIRFFIIYVKNQHYPNNSVIGIHLVLTNIGPVVQKSA